MQSRSEGVRRTAFIFDMDWMSQILTTKLYMFLTNYVVETLNDFCLSVQSCKSKAVSAYNFCKHVAKIVVQDIRSRCACCEKIEFQIIVDTVYVYRDVVWNSSIVGQHLIKETYVAYV